MNAWPPNPGCTLMKSSTSISSMYGSTASTAVSGLCVSPTPQVELAQPREERPRVAELDVDRAAVGTGLGKVVEEHPPGCRP